MTNPTTAPTAKEASANENQELAQTATPASQPVLEASSTNKAQAVKPDTVHIHKPLGQVTIPALICGLTGAVVAALFDFIHFYDSLFTSLQSIYESKPFYLENIDPWQRSWDWMIAVVLATAIAYVILDTAGISKRLFIAIISLILICTFSPMLMLWGAFWVPLAEMIAVFLASLFAIIYTSQHVMPCELGVRMKKVKKTKGEKINKAKKIKKHRKKSTPLRKSRLVRMLERPAKKTIHPEPSQQKASPSFKPIDNDPTQDA